MSLVSNLKLLAAEHYQYGLGQREAALPESLSAVRRTGLFVCSDRVAESHVRAIDDFCTRTIEERPDLIALESNGADTRIYGIDRLPGSDAIKELGRAMEDAAKQFYGSTQLTYFCMFGAIKALSNNAGSGSGWHRDSPFRHQFKTIVYLTDVSQDNGPFEFICGSHVKASVAESAAQLQRPLAADRYANDEVERLRALGCIAEPTTVVGPKGSMLHVDTRGLHRGRPLVSGFRRAITFYFYAGGIPKGIPLVRA